MLPSLVRDLIAQAFGTLADELVKEHYGALTQESQLTARIGGGLESGLNSLQILGYEFSVLTQDIPDRGKNSMESKTGIDLFISVSLNGEYSFSKGMLVQSKWDSKATKNNLISQCTMMESLSSASYAWLYTSKGVKVVDAQQIIKMKGSSVNRLRSRSLQQVMSELLQCNEGDPGIGVPPTPDRRSRVTSMLEEFRAKTSVDVQIYPNERGLPFVRG